MRCDSWKIYGKACMAWCSYDFYRGRTIYARKEDLQCDQLFVLLPNQVGKRRSGAKLALKTGMVAKKRKSETEVDSGKGDAWAKYMAEVQKYKAHQCCDDDKTRPLVK
ncbi:hypothetical protein GJAV_G00144140 [Gymnothorax javanicus]|nr:hypothetical protein GJAV_G00144140 [Gymnothorax javanicus]